MVIEEKKNKWDKNKRLKKKKVKFVDKDQKKLLNKLAKWKLKYNFHGEEDEWEDWEADE